MATMPDPLEELARIERQGWPNLVSVWNENTAHFMNENDLYEVDFRIRKSIYTRNNTYEVEVALAFRSNTWKGGTDTCEYTIGEVHISLAGTPIPPFEYEDFMFNCESAHTPSVHPYARDIKTVMKTSVYDDDDNEEDYRDLRRVAKAGIDHGAAINAIRKRRIGNAIIPNPNLARPPVVNHSLTFGYGRFGCECGEGVVCGIVRDSMRDANSSTHMLIEALGKKNLLPVFLPFANGYGYFKVSIGSVDNAYGERDKDIVVLTDSFNINITIDLNVKYKEAPDTVIKVLSNYYRSTDEFSKLTKVFSDYHDGRYGRGVRNVLKCQSNKHTLKQDRALFDVIDAAAFTYSKTKIPVALEDAVLANAYSEINYKQCAACCPDFYDPTQDMELIF